LNNVFRATIDFYDSDKFEEYLNNRPEPFIIFVTRIMELAQWHTGDGRHALDVGCGLGEYAKLLKDSGFSVSLVDTSRKMLKIASNQLGISAPDPIDLYCLSQNYEPESFDLIFASAVMVHVPRVRTLNVLKDFYQLLKPQGWLFINFDVKDHTLISLDNRYYEYYRDYTIPKSMLEGVGFKIEEIILRCNRRNISNDSKILHWANFFCRKY
jgi:ubiquinone/menaquinone biosynthesis C-methylase UbiE